MKAMPIAAPDRCTPKSTTSGLRGFWTRSTLRIVSAVLSALRPILATLLGVVLVLFERAIFCRTHALSHVRTEFDLRRRARPAVSFDRHPPEAWAAP